MGGGRTNIDIDCGTPTENLLIVKLLFNSIVSTPGAIFLGLDLKYFHLNTPMDLPEFLRIKISNFPDDVITHYNISDEVDKNSLLFIRTERGIYGLLHAKIIAQNLLEELPENHGYRQSDETTCFWKHDTSSISSTLIVYDFRVKYVGK